MMSGALLPASRRPNHWSKYVPGVTATVMVTPWCAVWYWSASFLNVSSECVVFQELSTRLASSGPRGGLPSPEEPAPQAASASAPVPIAPPIRNCLLSIGRSNCPAPTAHPPLRAAFQQSRVGLHTEATVDVGTAASSLIPTASTIARRSPSRQPFNWPENSTEHGATDRFVRAFDWSGQEGDKSGG